MEARLLYIRIVPDDSGSETGLERWLRWPGTRHCPKQGGDSQRVTEPEDLWPGGFLADRGRVTPVARSRFCHDDRRGLLDPGAEALGGVLALGAASWLAKQYASLGLEALGQAADHSCGR